MSDAALTSSSNYNTQTAAGFSRLNTPVVSGQHYGAWSAGSARLDEWIQVYLGSVKVIESVTSQGRSDANQYITQYEVLTSLDGEAFTAVSNAAGSADELFPGNQDRNSLVTNSLPVPVVARFVRILPTARRGWVSLRWDLNGCNYGTYTYRNPTKETE